MITLYIGSDHYITDVNLDLLTQGRWGAIHVVGIPGIVLSLFFYGELTSQNNRNREKR